MIKQKIKASLIHLTFSAIIVSLFLTFSLIIWYPEPFLEISGLKNIILMLVSVDLILGPLLTLIVFRPNKPSLKLDLSAIISIQAIALLYGATTIFQGHPVYVTFAVDRFNLVIAKDLNPEKSTLDEFRVSKFWKPKLAYAKLPEDPVKLSDLLSEVLQGKPDIEARPEYYESFDKFAKQVMQKGITQDKLSHNPENHQKLKDFLAKYGKQATDYAFIPLIGKDEDVLWAWDRASIKPVDIININPWIL